MKGGEAIGVCGSCSVNRLLPMHASHSNGALLWHEFACPCLQWRILTTQLLGVLCVCVC